MKIFQKRTIVQERKNNFEQRPRLLLAWVRQMKLMLVCIQFKVITTKIFFFYFLEFHQDNPACHFHHNNLLLNFQQKHPRFHFHKNLLHHVQKQTVHNVQLLVEIPLRQIVTNLVHYVHFAVFSTSDLVVTIVMMELKFAQEIVKKEQLFVRNVVNEQWPRQWWFQWFLGTSRFFKESKEPLNYSIAS